MDKSELLSWIQADTLKTMNTIGWAYQNAKIAYEQIEIQHRSLDQDACEMLVGEKQMLLGGLVWAIGACLYGVVMLAGHAWRVYNAPARSYEELEKQCRDEEGGTGE